MQSHLGIDHKYRQSRVFTLHNILQILFQPVNQIFLFFFAVSVRCFDSRPMFSQLFFLDFRIGLSVNFGSDNRRMAQQIPDINLVYIRFQKVHCPAVTEAVVCDAAFVKARIFFTCH